MYCVYTLYIHAMNTVTLEKPKKKLSGDHSYEHDTCTEDGGQA